MHYSNNIVDDKEVSLISEVSSYHYEALAISVSANELLLEHKPASEEQAHLLYEQAYAYELRAIDAIPMDYKWRPILVYSAAIMAEYAGYHEDSERLFREVEARIPCGL